MLALELLVVILFQGDFKGGPKLSCSGKCVRVMFLAAADLVLEWLLRFFVSQYHLFSTYTLHFSRIECKPRARKSGVNAVNQPNDCVNNS